MAEKDIKNTESTDKEIMGQEIMGQENTGQESTDKENTDGTESSMGTEALTKDKIVEAIKTIYDPEIPVDVYELGLIYEISIYPVNNVYVQMTLTSPSCPSAEQIPSEVEAKVRSIEGVNEVNVELTFDPPYTQDMMSEVAKLELGFM